eukprot:455333-Rhodomonas_salina.1
MVQQVFRDVTMQEEKALSGIRTHLPNSEHCETHQLRSRVQLSARGCRQSDGSCSNISLRNWQTQHLHLFACVRVCVCACVRVCFNAAPRVASQSPAATDAMTLMLHRADHHCPTPAVQHLAGARPAVGNGRCLALALCLSAAHTAARLHAPTLRARPSGTCTRKGAARTALQDPRCCLRRADSILERTRGQLRKAQPRALGKSRRGSSLVQALIRICRRPSANG